MSALSIQPTYPIFTETDGQPLEDGYIWIGQVNLDPHVNPINVYFDAALTIPAGQPIRTINGYPSRSGSPARLYVNSDYSIRVMNRNGSVVYSAPAATERYSEVVVNTNAASVVYDPPFTGGVATTAADKLAQTASVKDFGAVGDGVTDDTAAIQTALDSGTARITGSGLSYILSSALTVPDNTVFDGEGGVLLLSDSTSSGSAMSIGSDCEVKNWSIRSSVSGTKKGYYGILVPQTSSNVFVHNINFKDIQYSAIANAADDSRFFDITAVDCGWDLIQNYRADTTGPNRVHVHRCNATRTGRHGFSTDTGASDVIFEDCIATDIGNPSLDEGKDPYHYEGCIRAQIKNCVANYTANHPVVTTSAVNLFNAFREFASIDCLIDGLVINVESGFAFSSGGTLNALYVDNATTNLRVRGFQLLNKSSTSAGLTFANTNAQNFLEFSGFVLYGKTTYTQSTTSGGVKRIANGIVVGTGIETTFNNQYISANLEIDNVTFENVATAIRYAGFQNSVIKNCRFKDCGTYAIKHDWYSYTGTYRPTYGAVMGCYFSGTNGTLLNSRDSVVALTFANNVINGTASVGLEAQSTFVKGFGNIVTGTVTTAQTGTNGTGAFNTNLNNLASV